MSGKRKAKHCRIEKPKAPQQPKNSLLVRIPESLILFILNFLSSDEILSQASAGSLRSPDDWESAGYVCKLFNEVMFGRYDWENRKRLQPDKDIGWESQRTFNFWKGRTISVWV